MTREESKKFMKEISALYPSTETKLFDASLTLDLWAEMLEDVDFKTAHKALIEYAKRDINGFPPTFGQLFPPEEEVICIRDETIEDWN